MYNKMSIPLIFFLTVVYTGLASGDGTDLISLEDRQAITEAVSRFSHTFDKNKFNEFIDLFTEDAKIAFFSEGRQLLVDQDVPTREMLETSLTIFQQNGFSINRHFLTNTQLQRIGDSEVLAQSWFLVISQKEDQSAPILTLSGEFHDIYIKTNGVWKCRRHEVHIDQPS